MIGNEVDQIGLEYAERHGHDDGVRVVIDSGTVDCDGLDAAGIDLYDGSVEEDIAGDHAIKIQLVECVEISHGFEAVDRA